MEGTNGCGATLIACLKHTAAAFPARRAVAFKPMAVLDKLELTHAALDALVDAAAARLAAEAGVLPGHVVALAFPNTVELVIMFLAVIRARAVASPLNPAYTQEEFEFYLSDSEARLLVTNAEGNAAAQAAAAKLGLAHAAASLTDAGPLHLAGLAKAASGNRTGAQGAADFGNEPSDTALLLHTSGTTGRPKAVPLTQANLAASVQNIRSVYHLAETDATVVVVPLFHLHGLLCALMSSLASGASVALPAAGRFSASTFWADMRAAGATWYTAEPRIHQIILDRHAARPEPAPPALRFIRSCGPSLAPAILERLEASFGAPVLEAYAMTEASHLVASNPLPRDGPRKPGSVGRAVGQEVAILDEGGAPVAPGLPGEVCIRGPNVTAGYKNNPEANEAAFRLGLFRTGHTGVMDDEGNLHINRSGEAHDVVIIVGAGPSGLAVAACLHNMGIPYRILERGSSIAPQWRNNGGFMLPLPKEFYELPLMALPDHYPEYITYGQVADYLDAYAARFGINPDLDTTVKWARYDATFGLWQVRAVGPGLGEMGLYSCRTLVVATGENGDRVIPHIPGLAGFMEAGGTVTHVGDYTSGEAYRGQRVLVVGCDNSGMEVALDLYDNGARPTVAARGAMDVLPRKVLGKPTVLVAMLLERWLPLWAVDKVMVIVARVLLGDVLKLGFLRPATGMLDPARGRVLVLDHGALKVIRDGKIAVAPDVGRFNRGQVEFVNGKTLDIDAVVLATGYRSNVPQANWHGDRNRYPATAFPFSWAGRCGLYAVGFSRRGYCAVSTQTQAMRVAEEIGRAWMEQAESAGRGDGNENDALVTF